MNFSGKWTEFTMRRMTSKMFWMINSKVILPKISVLIANTPKMIMNHQGLIPDDSYFWPNETVARNNDQVYFGLRAEQVSLYTTG